MLSVTCVEMHTAVDHIAPHSAFSSTHGRCNTFTKSLVLGGKSQNNKQKHGLGHSNARQRQDMLLAAEP